MNVYTKEENKLKSDVTFYAQMLLIIVNTVPSANIFWDFGPTIENQQQFFWASHDDSPTGTLKWTFWNSHLLVAAGTRLAHQCVLN
jgi:hypothetical protein